MGQAQINVRTRACSRTSIARTKQAALTHNVRGKELRKKVDQIPQVDRPLRNWPMNADINVTSAKHFWKT